MLLIFVAMLAVSVRIGGSVKSSYFSISFVAAVSVAFAFPHPNHWIQTFPVV